jgi:succinyl-CoA synthetase beta subunit
MKIHEYQGKTILAKFGVPVPRGEVVFTPAEAEAAAKNLGGGTVVVKAQIHAGGRGKGGGVKVVKNPEAAADAAKALLGMTLVTYQTGPEGRVVGRVLVEEGLAIERELYLGIVIDRATKQPVLMVSPDGGVEIEKVAAESGRRTAGVSGAAARVRPRSVRSADRPGREADDRCLQRVRRDRRLDGRDQPAHRDR